MAERGGGFKFCEKISERFNRSEEKTFQLWGEKPTRYSSRYFSVPIEKWNVFIKDEKLKKISSPIYLVNIKLRIF